MVSKLITAGNQIKNALGADVPLLGTNYSGFEWASGLDGLASVGGQPTHAQQLTEMVTHSNFNCISIGINMNWHENYAAYRANIANFITAADAVNVYVILKYFWLDNYSQIQPYNYYHPRPNAYYTRLKALWTLLATTYKASNNVIFEVWHEPNSPTYVNWAKYRTDVNELIAIIRAEPADNLIIIEGMNSIWSGFGNLEGWVPTDTGNTFAFDWHAYSSGLANATTEAQVITWLTDHKILEYAASYPVICGEIGHAGSATTQGIINCLHVFRDNDIDWQFWNWCSNGIMSPDGMFSSYFVEDEDGEIFAAMIAEYGTVPPPDPPLPPLDEEDEDVTPPPTSPAKTLSYTRDPARWGQGQWGYFRWGVYTDRWEKMLKPLRQEYVRHKRVWHTKRDRTTGWRIPKYTTSPVTGVLVERGGSVAMLPAGTVVKMDAVFVCIDGFELRDRIEDEENGVVYEVKQIEKTLDPKAGGLAYRTCHLSRQELYKEGI